MDTLTPVDELLFGMHSTIEQHGWMLMSVFGDARHPPWTYTIGLSRRCSHPELVVVGLPSCCAGELLNRLGTRVDTGDRLDVLAGGETTVEGSPYRLVPVHPKQWGTDLFAAWLNYFGTIGSVPDAAALQVVWADDAGHFPGHPDFDRSLRRRTRRLDRAPRARKR
jgi:hypothetical protein